MLDTQEQIELGTGLKEIALDVVERAMQAGATAADAIARDGNEFSTLVRMGEVETLKESGARALGLRVFVGKRAAETHTSDFSRDGIERLVSGAISLARATSEDPAAGLPEAESLGSLKQNL
ncbi:MAG TPA: DNA gyrase modulator, partial [Terriglobales bacterium]|nr:DNA gyrase modulator [Terriglobales bacterium]